MKLRQLDRRFLAREDEPEEVEVARTNGCYVYDERGRRYIDFLSGWCVGNFGWGNSEITKRPRRRRPDYVNPEYLSGDRRLRGGRHRPAGRHGFDRPA